MQSSRQSILFAAILATGYAPAALAHGDLTVIYPVLLNLVTVVTFLALLSVWRSWPQRGIVSAYFFAGLLTGWLLAFVAPSSSDNLLPKLSIGAGPFVGWLIGWYKAQKHPRGA